MSLNPHDDCIHCDRGTCGGRCQPEEDHSGEEWEMAGPGRVLSGPQVVGEAAGDRLMRSQDVDRAVRFTGLTPSQVAAVLHGLADHTALLAALDYSKPKDGYWPEATSLGRWLHDAANQLEDRHGRIQ